MGHATTTEIKGNEQMTEPSNFLDAVDLVILTGRRTSGRQREQLLAMKVPFAINGIGEPLVPKCFLEGQKMRARKQIAEVDQRLAWLRSLY